MLSLQTDSSAVFQILIPQKVLPNNVRIFLFCFAFESEGVVDSGGEFLGVMGYYDQGLLRI